MAQDTGPYLTMLHRVIQLRQRRYRQTEKILFCSNKRKLRCTRACEWANSRANEVQKTWEASSALNACNSLKRLANCHLFFWSIWSFVSFVLHFSSFNLQLPKYKWLTYQRKVWVKIVNWQWTAWDFQLPFLYGCLSCRTFPNKI